MSHHDPHSDQDQPAEAHAEAHDEPPPPDEPKTPAWLTVVGVSLFVVAGMWFLATRPDAKTMEQLREAQPVAPSATVAAPVAPRASAAPAAQPAPVRPSLQMLRPGGQPTRLP